MREDLVSSAVTFLHETRGSDATLESKTSFLKTKGLKQDEIDEAFKRAESGPVATATTATTAAPTNADYQARQQYQNHDAYIRQQWPEYSMRPPPIPQRDWKDYFVMATVSVGVAYGIFEVVRRYVVPAIKPPPPSSFEADKDALAAEFDRAEAILEQIQKDTDELKKSEQDRASAFEQILQDARNAVAEVRTQSEERKQDMKQLKQSIEIMQDQLPKAIQRNHDLQEEALKSLESELKSLKALTNNRMKSVGGPPPASMVPSSLPSTVPSSGPKSIETPVAAPNINYGPPKQTPFVPQPAGATQPNTGSSSGTPSSPSVPSAGIPAWQLAAQKGK